METIDYRRSIEQLEEALHSDPEKEKSYSLELIAYGKQHQDSHALFIGYIYMFDYSISIRDFSTSQCYMYEALSISSDEYKDEQMRLYIHCGLYYYFRSDAHAAIDYYCKALHISEEIQNIERRGAIYNNIALVFYQYHNYEEALHYYLEAYRYMKLSSSTYMEQSCAIIVGNIISNYVMLNDLDNAKKYFAIYQKTTSPSAMSLCLEASIAHVSHEQERALSCIHALYVRLKEDNLDLYLQYTLLEDVLKVLLDIGTKEEAFDALTRFSEVSDHDNADEMLILLSYYKTYVEKFHLQEALPELYQAYYTLTEKSIKRKDALRSKTFHDQMMLDRLFQLNKSLQQSASYDVVSGLRNRNCYEQDITTYLQSDAITTLGILMCDIDDFKEYNDEFGHLYGDKILHKLADALLAYADKEIIPYRFGGDEFLCILLNKSEQDVQQYIDSIYAHLKSDEHIKISIGTATLPLVAVKDISELLTKADHALYMAKKTGKNRHVKYR